MYGKAVLSLISVLSLLVGSSIYFSSVDVRSYFFTRAPSPSTARLLCPPVRSSLRPLRVYMYDLPRRFNVGMLDRRNPDQTPVTARGFPSWPANSGLRRQHSVEYWLMASLLYDGDGGGEEREAVRVSDPEMADAFFVPFFSSLSVNIHGRNMTDPDTEIDHRLQMDLLEFLRQSKYWQRSAGRDHVIPMTHPNAFRFLRGQEGIIRAKLAMVLAGYDDVHYVQSVATKANIKESSQGMRSSKFCLHPAGDTPSSCRLFDAIVSHCIPVIVSDEIELPFEDELDYSEFSIFFSSKEALEPGYMVNQLRQIQKDRWIKMWKQLKNISHHFEFQNPPKQEDAVNMLWRQVKNKLPATKLSVHRSRRLKVPDWWRRRR